MAAAKQEIVAAMATIFATTANFFRGEGKTPWDKIFLRHETHNSRPSHNL
jgi:hypothetical protein